MRQLAGTKRPGWQVKQLLAAAEAAHSADCCHAHLPRLAVLPRGTASLPTAMVVTKDAMAWARCLLIRAPGQEKASTLSPGNCGGGRGATKSVNRHGCSGVDAVAAAAQRGWSKIVGDALGFNEL